MTPPTLKGMLDGGRFVSLLLPEGIEVIGMHLSTPSGETIVSWSSVEGREDVKLQLINPSGESVGFEVSDVQRYLQPKNDQQTRHNTKTPDDPRPSDHPSGNTRPPGRSQEDRPPPSSNPSPRSHSFPRGHPSFHNHTSPSTHPPPSFNSKNSNGSQLGAPKPHGVESPQVYRQPESRQLNHLSSNTQGTNSAETMTETPPTKETQALKDISTTVATSSGSVSKRNEVHPEQNESTASDTTSNILPPQDTAQITSNPERDKPEELSDNTGLVNHSRNRSRSSSVGSLIIVGEKTIRTRSKDDDKTLVASSSDEEITDRPNKRRKLNPQPIDRELTIEDYTDLGSRFPNWPHEQVFLKLRNSREHTKLCQMPLIRDVRLKTEEIAYWFPKVIGYLIQSRGTKNAQPCFSCTRRVTSPFKESECISMWNDRIQASNGACSICVWQSQNSGCSYRDTRYDIKRHRLKASETITEAILAKKVTDRIKIQMGRFVPGVKE